jgi:hypothetical protein
MKFGLQRKEENEEQAKLELEIKEMRQALWN